MVNFFHVEGTDGQITMPSKTGRIPRMPSTQPTMTVLAVPVSQWTCDLPKFGLREPSVNCPCAYGSIPRISALSFISAGLHSR